MWLPTGADYVSRGVSDGVVIANGDPWGKVQPSVAANDELGHPRRPAGNVLGDMLAEYGLAVEAAA